MSLKKAKYYLGNELQVDSAIKDGKGQVIHQTYVNKTIPDGTIDKLIGFNSLGALVKSLGIPYLTTAPTQANTDGLIIVVLSSEPATYYSGYYYIITESNA